MLCFNSIVDIVGEHTEGVQSFVATCMGEDGEAVLGPVTFQEAMKLANELRDQLLVAVAMVLKAENFCVQHRVRIFYTEDVEQRATHAEEAEVIFAWLESVVGFVRSIDTSACALLATAQARAAFFMEVVKHSREEPSLETHEIYRALAHLCASETTQQKKPTVGAAAREHDLPASARDAVAKFNETMGSQNVEVLISRFTRKVLSSENLVLATEKVVAAAEEVGGITPATCAGLAKTCRHFFRLREAAERIEKADPPGHSEILRLAKEFRS